MARRARLVAHPGPGDNAESLLRMRRECERFLSEDGHPWAGGNRAA